MVDMWSIGIIILEVLVGPELVLQADASDAVEGLLDSCKDYIDASTLDLLEDMLFHYGDPDLDHYCEKVLVKSSATIDMGVRKMIYAKGDDSVLLDALEDFRGVVNRESLKYSSRYGYVLHGKGKDVNAQLTVKTEAT